MSCRHGLPGSLGKVSSTSLVNCIYVFCPLTYRQRYRFGYATLTIHTPQYDKTKSTHLITTLTDKTKHDLRTTPTQTIKLHYYLISLVTYFFEMNQQM